MSTPVNIKCAGCLKNEPLYKCPTCATTAHINLKTKEIVIHLAPMAMPKSFERFGAPISMCFPSHFNCELAKPIADINLAKLVRVE